MKSALWPLSKHKDKDKATATVVVVAVAVDVVAVAKVKVKDNGIGKGKSKKTTLKRPRIASIVGQNGTCKTRRGKRALTLVKNIKGK